MKEDLLACLETSQSRNKHLGRRNFKLTYIFYILVVLSSFAATILIVADDFDNKKLILTIISAIPGAAVLANNVLKFEQRSRWYYKKARLTRHLLWRVKFQNFDISNATDELIKMDRILEREWPGFGTVLPQATEVDRD